MKRLIPVALLTVLIAGTATGQASQNTNAVSTMFCRGGALTPAEVQDLLLLAQRSGIKHVASIETLYMHPSTNIQIRVKEAETTDGDKIRYRTLNAFRKGWVPESWSKPEGKAAVGLFWEDSVDHSDLTLVEVDGQLVRVTLRDGITKAEATPILSALVHRRWDARDANLRLALDKVDAGLRPSHLSRGKAGDGYRAIFSSRLKSWTVSFEFNDGTLVVTRVLFAIS